jgi:hypothetical protein
MHRRSRHLWKPPPSTALLFLHGREAPGPAIPFIDDTWDFSKAASEDDEWREGRRGWRLGFGARHS